MNCEMHGLVDPLLVLVLLINFVTLGASRLRFVIDAAAAQGVVLGLLTICAHGTVEWRIVAMGAAAMLLKGVFIPLVLIRAMREVRIRHEVEPFVGFVPSILLGGVATAVAFVFAGTLPPAAEHRGSLLIPASIATALVGFLLMVSRRKAIMQVVGYLILENGIFILGLGLLEAMPYLVEAGVLLDLFVCVLVFGIIIDQISREFETIDTGRLTALKEE